MLILGPNPGLDGERAPESRENAASRLPATTRLDATRSFIRTIFGDEVAGWEAFVKNVFSHAEQLQATSCREVLRAFRHSQLRVLRAERTEYEARLRELHRSELLLTPPEERSGLLRSPPPERVSQ